MRVNIEYEITVEFSGVNLTRIAQEIDQGVQDRSCGTIHPEFDVFHAPNGHHELTDKL